MDICDPFIEDYGYMLNLDTKIIMNKDLVQTVCNIENIADRLTNDQNRSLADIVTKNRLPLLSTSNAKMIEWQKSGRVIED